MSYSFRAARQRMMRIRPVHRRVRVAALISNHLKTLNEKIFSLALALLSYLCFARSRGFTTRRQTHLIATRCALRACQCGRLIGIAGSSLTWRTERLSATGNVDIQSSHLSKDERTVGSTTQSSKSPGFPWRTFATAHLAHLRRGWLPRRLPIGGIVRWTLNAQSYHISNTHVVRLGAGQRII